MKQTYTVTVPVLTENTGDLYVEQHFVDIVVESTSRYLAVLQASDIIEKMDWDGKFEHYEDVAVDKKGIVAKKWEVISASDTDHPKHWSVAYRVAYNRHRGYMV